MSAGDQYSWHKTVLGHTFSVQRAIPANCEGREMITTIQSWLRDHEEAQVMVASVLVVVGLWWLLRALVAIIINLVCPVVVVVLAVVCVPQLRRPLLGANYPKVATILRTLLMRMAENITV